MRSVVTKVVRSTAVGALVCGATLGLLAGPAAAHATLIGASPAPGATLTAAPKTIELDFDEPVEAVFGKTKVYDVDAKRVDANRVDLSNGGQAVLVRMKTTGNGTFTVAWNIVSDDGHVEDGTFQYYVGAPSSRAAAAVPIGGGTSTFANVLAGISRFGWYFSLALLAGIIIVRRWRWAPLLAAIGAPGPPDPMSHGNDGDASSWPVATSLGAAVTAETATTPTPDAVVSADIAFDRDARAALRWAWPVLALSALLLLWTEAAIASGKSMWGAANPSVLNDLLGTNFGQAWKVQALAVVLLAIPVLIVVRDRAGFGLTVRQASWLIVELVVVACIGTALGGHARQSAYPVATVIAVTLHVAAAAVWAGGLIALAVLAVPAWKHINAAARPKFVGALVRAFGSIALVAVIVIAASGIVLGFAELSAVSDLWHTTYGKVLLVKIFLFASALGFAGWHRYVTDRRLAQSDGSEVARFEASSLVESSVLVGVLAVAAVLVALVPGRAIAARTNGLADSAVRVGAYTATVAVSPGAIGDNEVHVTFTDKSGASAAAVKTTVVTLRAADGATRAVPMQLLSPGHFSGSATLTVAGRNELRIAVPKIGVNGAASATFGFLVRAPANAAVGTRE